MMTQDTESPKTAVAFTKSNRILVWKRKFYQVDNKDIAAEIGVSLKDLKRLFASDLKNGPELYKRWIQDQLHIQAESGNFKAVERLAEMAEIIDKPKYRRGNTAPTMRDFEKAIPKSQQPKPGKKELQREAAEKASKGLYAPRGSVN